MHLVKLISYYNDTGQSKLALYYLRNKEKVEVDFLITNKGIPLFTIEVKTNDTHIDKNYLVFQKKLNVPHFQIIKVPYKFNNFGSGTVVSFEEFFLNLP